jgi:hypothetical protein
MGGGGGMRQKVTLQVEDGNLRGIKRLAGGERWF